MLINFVYDLLNLWHVGEIGQCTDLHTNNWSFVDEMFLFINCLDSANSYFSFILSFVNHLRF